MAKKSFLMGINFFLNTKIVSILMALVIFAGIDALAAYSATSTFTNYQQKDCKTSWIPVKS